MITRSHVFWTERTIHLLNDVRCKQAAWRYTKFTPALLSVFSLWFFIWGTQSPQNSIFGVICKFWGSHIFFYSNHYVFVVINFLLNSSNEIISCSLVFIRPKALPTDKKCISLWSGPANLITISLLMCVFCLIVTNKAFFMLSLDVCNCLFELFLELQLFQSSKWDFELPCLARVVPRGS